MRVGWIGSCDAAGQIAVFLENARHVPTGFKRCNIHAPRQTGIAVRAGRSIDPIFNTAESGAGKPIMAMWIKGNINSNTLFGLPRNIGAVTSHAKTHGQRNFAVKAFVLIHLSRLPKRPSPNQGQSYAKQVIFLTGAIVELANLKIRSPKRRDNFVNMSGSPRFDDRINLGQLGRYIIEKALMIDLDNIATTFANRC